MCAAFSRNSGVPAARYEKVYRLLLEDTLEALPNVHLVLYEPFILPVGVQKERWEEHKTEIDKRRDVVEGLAKEFDAVLV